MTGAEPDGVSTPSSPERVAELVSALAAVMRQSEVTELDLALGSMTVRLRRPESDGAAGSATSAEATKRQAIAGPDPGHVVTSPMVGTFYAAPTPGAAPFVSEGDDVIAGQTIGIIEAMKIMNEVTADRSGVVLELLVDNGQPVEYGSSLLRLGAIPERQ